MHKAGSSTVDVSTDRLAAALRFLSTASRALASSLDYRQSLEEVADLVIATMAQSLAVAIFDEKRSPDVLVERGPQIPLADAPLLSRINAPAAEGASAHFGHLIDLRLVARDVTLGAMRVGRIAGAFSETDIALLEELALRIAIAIDSAHVYAREHRVADTLQRALLPEALPQRGNGRCYAAYRPGAKEAIVGGDWYDAFELPDGTLALSIGDVAGHGLRAAVVMGEVRQTFRAAALNPKSPSEVLERANTILNMRETPTMVTALFAIYNPLTSTITYATAGHPPPVLASRCGHVEMLPSEGIPLGVAPRIDARDWTFTLPPGSLFTLYTDGLIEYDRNVIAGEAALLAAIAAEIDDPTADPARSLQQRIFASRTNTDDVATLALAIADHTPPNFAFEFSAIPLAVPFVRHSLRRFTEVMGISEEDRFAVITAVGEAIANAVEHAYGGRPPGIARVVATPSEGTLTITVEDAGRWRPAQKRDERGRGLPLMKMLMDGVEIRSNAQSTVIRLTKALAPLGAGT